METNIVTNHILENAANQVESVLHLPVPILLMLVLNGLAIIIRKSPIKNWVISLMMVIVATVAYPQLTSSANTVFKIATNGVLYLQGCLLGLASLGIDQFLEKFAWYRAFTKSISEDKTVAHIEQQIDAAKKDAENTRTITKLDIGK